MPYHAEFRRRVGGSDFPLWTGYPGGGLPLASVPDAGTLGPLNLPYRVLPLWYAPGIAKLIEMAVAMAFTALFLRRLGLERPPAVAGGLFFALSGYQIVWTNFPQSHVGALIPALFWAVERGLQERDLRNVLPVAPIVAAMILEGFPSVTGYALLAVGGYALVRVLAERGTVPRLRVKTLLMLTGMVVVGFGVTAAQALPFASRTAQLDLDYRVQFAGSHLPPSTLATSVIPDAFGSPVDGTYWGPLNYVEIQSFVGVTVVVLLVAAAAWPVRRALPRGTRGALWGIAALCGVVLYLGGPLLTGLQLTPLFRLNFVTRLRSVLGFALAVVAALGLQALADGREGRRGRAVAAWGAALVVAVSGLIFLWRLAERSRRTEDLVQAALMPLAVGALAVVGAWLPRRIRPAGRATAIWLLPPLFAAEALAVAIPFWPTVPKDDFYPVTPVHRTLQGSLGADRFVGMGGAMAPGSATFYGLRSLTTNNTLPQLSPWEDLIRAADPDAYSGSPVNPILSPKANVLASPILDRLAVRFAVAPPTTPVAGRRLVVVPAGQETVTLPAGGRLRVPVPGSRVRATIVHLSRPPEIAGPARLVARLVAGSDTILAQGEQRLYPGTAAGPVQVPMAEPRCDRCPSGLQLELELEAPRGEALLAGEGDLPAVTVVIAVDDGLRVELVENAVVYRRLRALPRLRWAGTARTVQDPGGRVRLLAAGVPEDEVVLTRPAPSGSGLRARLQVLEDSGDVVRVGVDAAGMGYLVVADPIQHGWTASIDGRPTSLLAADHALVAVAVPGGRHVVELRSDPPGWDLGVVLSGASITSILGVFLVSARRRRLRPTGRAS
jgi:hypothetical protein